MLSFSTKGSAKHAATGKVAAATALKRGRKPTTRLEMEIDGELQADTALLPDWRAQSAEVSWRERPTC